MALIRKLFWVALFVVSTFGFVVLFDYGTTDFMKNAKVEFDALKKTIQEQTGHDNKKPEGGKTDK